MSNVAKRFFLDETKLPLHQGTTNGIRMRAGSMQPVGGRTERWLPMP
jgi:hypothetical protein